MPKTRGRSHTTLTKTADKVMRIIKDIDGIKMIAPGEIAARRSRSQRITIVHTRAGCELQITGNGIQKLAVHTTSPHVCQEIVARLQHHKDVAHFIHSQRRRQPGT